MTTIPASTFDFLKQLRKNNNKTWFNDHKSDYKEAQESFIVFIDELIRKIAKFDPSIAHHTGKDCVFRIYRDVRFSKDKSPYKTNFGAHITAAGKKSEIHSRAGYYIHLEPGNSMLAGGAYLPQGAWLKGIRQEIMDNADDLKKIINGKQFKMYFGELDGDKLKTAPRGIPKDHPEIELLRFKSFLATHPCPNEQVLAPNFLQHAAKVFKTLAPFDDFLNRVVK